jgi:hypothetical protein
MPARIGDRLGDLTFLRPDGSELRLAHLPERALVLIALRHLA